MLDHVWLVKENNDRVIERKTKWIVFPHGRLADSNSSVEFLHLATLARLSVVQRADDDSMVSCGYQVMHDD